LVVKSASILTLLAVLFAAGVSAPAAEPALLRVRKPVPYQVVQRQGFQPRKAHEHHPGGPALGFALVPLEADLSAIKNNPAAPLSFRWRVVLREAAYGQSTEWATVEGTRDGDVWRATVRVPAGGWYRLDLAAHRGENVAATGAVDPLGVGEVFVVAGQSYAVGANDEVLKVADPLARISAYDWVHKNWQVAHDPQPQAGDGGTIWPALGDFLVPLVRVPVGFVNVAVGGTATRQWLPGEKLYEQLADAGQQVGRFRAVLWQQGESDVIEHRPTDYYVKNMTTIRDGLNKRWGFEPPWLLAKSTLHPTVYRDPEGEERIRAAIDQLCALPGFQPGPDTDILGREHRGGLNTRRHFSGIGQRRAGLMWFAAIWQMLNQDP
jgi:hypothetical protein